LTLATSSDIDHNSLTNYDIAEHRVIDDSIISTTDLWSSNKIDEEINSLVTMEEHANEWHTIDFEDSANKGVSGGYAGLDANAQVPLSQLPDTSKQVTIVLTSSDDKPTDAIEGDKAYETDTGDSYIYDGTEWVLLASADWENVDIDWANLINVPSEFTPENHDNTAHTEDFATTSELFSGSYDDLTDKPSLFSGSYDDLTDIPNTFTPESHDNTAHSTNYASQSDLDSHVGSGGTAHADVTTDTDGFMTSGDKSKLDGIESGANNYSLESHNNDHHSTNYASESDFNSHTGSGGGAHSNATTSTAGFMSDGDKSKLNDIDDNANNYSLENHGNEYHNEDYYSSGDDITIGTLTGLGSQLNINKDTEDRPYIHIDGATGNRVITLSQDYVTDAGKMRLNSGSGENLIDISAGQYSDGYISIKSINSDSTVELVSHSMSVEGSLIDADYMYCAELDGVELYEDGARVATRDWVDANAGGMENHGNEYHTEDFYSSGDDASFSGVTIDGYSYQDRSYVDGIYARNGGSFLIQDDFTMYGSPTIWGNPVFEGNTVVNGTIKNGNFAFRIDKNGTDGTGRINFKT